MTDFQASLEKYAELIVKVGVNIQPGQTLFMNAPLPSAALVRIAAHKAYEAGARHVHVDWSDEQLTHTKYKLAPSEAFEEYPMWRAKGLEELAENGAAFVSIYAPSPDLMQDVDPERIAAFAKTSATALKRYREMTMAHQVAWSVVSVATEEWAAKIYPELPPADAVDQLWDVIFKAVRADQADPVEAWKKHNAMLAEKVNYLNDKRYKQLVYRAPGTELSIELPVNHVWLGGAKDNAKGIWFNPNMPTEEVFTMPHKDGVNGTVRSTKPLNYSGKIINNFSLTFKDGKVIGFEAEQGKESLAKLLETDEGAARLGEVALVPHKSPISMSNLVFYNTLFDENASSHLALGQAYSVNLKQGQTLSREELTAAGVNSSLVHVDFMIGSGEMDVDGVTEDGRTEALMRQGEWVEQ